MLHFFLLCTICTMVATDISTEEVQYLNELSIEKLIQLKNSLKDFSTELNNITETTPYLIGNFGAQAMALNGPQIKRSEYEEGLYKKGGYGKISNIFSMSVTALAFLAFGGYLLCLIVHAVKSKQNMVVTTPAPTFVVNAGIKRPQATFSSYGRRKIQKRELQKINVPPEELFTALLSICEGYAKWSKGNENMQ